MSQGAWIVALAFVVIAGGIYLAIAGWIVAPFLGVAVLIGFFIWLARERRNRPPPE